MLTAAKNLIKDEVGEEVFETEENTNTDSDTPETFNDDFVHKSITSNSWPGESYHGDIAFIRQSWKRN